MALSLAFSSHVFSSSKSPSAGHMGRQTPPAVRSTWSGNVRFRRCSKARGLQASAGAEGLISESARTKSKNFYEVLEISPSATTKEIRKAYRTLAREFHPDQATSPQGKIERTQIFLRIHNAYVTLSDPQGRCQYDRQISGEVRGFAEQTWGKATGERAPTYRYHGRVGRSWETDQCW